VDSANHIAGVAMYRSKLKYNYHEAVIRSVEFRENEISLEIELNDWAEHIHGAFTHLTFYGAQNAASIQRQLQKRISSVANGEPIDEIISLGENAEGTFSVYLSKLGEIRFETRRFTET
jgi:hypothetical protein